MNKKVFLYFRFKDSTNRLTRTEVITALNVSKGMKISGNGGLSFCLISIKSMKRVHEIDFNSNTIFNIDNLLQQI